VPQRLAQLTALLAALALAVGLAACGSSSDSGGGSDAAALLKDTFGADHPIRSGRLDADLDVNLPQVRALGNTPLKLHINGPFQSNGGTRLPDFALGVDFEGGQNPVTVGAVFAQGGGYLTIEGQAFTLGSDIYKAFANGYLSAKRDADRKANDRSQPTLAALGIDPLRWLTGARTVGSEDIAGSDTEHVAAGVNVPVLLDDVSKLLGRARSVTSSASSATGTNVPTQLSAAQRASIEKAIKSAKVDVWTGAKDHTLRKVAVNVQLDQGHVIFDVTLAQLNQQQAIRKPAGARPISQLRSALSQLGLVGSSSTATPQATTTPDASGTATATTPAPSASGTQSDYAQCIDAAGEDLAKVQACAKYIK
jgi:hypothetical protein